MPETLRSTKDVARLLRVAEWRLHDVVRRDEARPTVVAGRRLWGEADIRAARTVLAARGALPESPANDTARSS